jgi:hypothetical protein
MSKKSKYINKYINKEKGVTVEAARFEDSFPFYMEMQEWEGASKAVSMKTPGEYSVFTPSEVVTLLEGDYIIRTKKGSFYVCASEIFNEKFELVERKAKTNGNKSSD